MPLVLDGTNGVSGVDGTASNPAIEGTDSNTGIFYPAADTVAIGTGGTERLRVDSAGNAGLGITPSAWWSSVKALQVSGASLLSAGTEATLSANAFLDSGIAWRYRVNGSATYAEQASGAFKWYTAASGTAGNAITFTQAMTLDASGNLLLGATSAAVAESGADNLVVGPGTGNNGITIYSANTGNCNLNFADTDNNIVGFIQYQHSGNNMNFRTNGAERARITSGGDFFLADEAQSLGLNQYSNKRWLKFNYPAAGQFAAANDCTDFYAAGNGSSLVQMRLSQFGNVGARGTFSGGQTLNDYAEYFEWSDGNENNEDRIGMTVVLDGEKVRLTTSQDSPADVVGVVSATAGVILGSAPFEWAGKYKKDEYGRTITRKVTWVHWSQDGQSHNYKSDEIPNDIVVPEDVEYKTYDEPVLSDNFSESIEYTAREHRKEWGCIGLVGQVHVKKGQLVGDRWRKMKDVSDNVELWLIR